MSLTGLTEPIRKHIDIARRISKAEIKYREISLKTFGSAAPSSGKKPDPAHKDNDEKVAKIMQGIIAPRLARLRTSYFGLHQPHPISDWWGVSWLFALWEGEPGISIHRHERRITNIELMLNLVENRDSLDSEFWNKVTRWQLLRYQRNTREILEEFGRRLPRSAYICPSHIDYMHALSKAVELAQAEQPLNNATWADVFVIRHIYYDPTLKATVDAYWTPTRERRNLMAKIDQQILEEPHFPTEGHALKFTIDSRLPSVFK
ncbi:hypothetical protein FRC01_011114 [Tulasnella sp. 417]|nr:hypothetical protein FRC01_011114 [Tulasnella sp. 417]